MTCGQVRGEKSLKIHTAPDILVLHLKRFKFAGSRAWKIGTKVAFPERLELGPYMSPSNPAQFSLVGVVVHSGASLGSGHYFAYVKSKGGAWFQKNDSMVRGHLSFVPPPPCTHPLSPWPRSVVSRS